MNILLINHYAGSPQLGMEYRPYLLAKEWIKKNNKVTIIASSFSHVRITQPNVNENLVNELIDSIEYCWIKTPSYHGNGIKRFINILSFVIKLWKNSKYFVQQYQPDIVIASSTYPLDIYPAYRIAKLSGAKLVFEVHDLWPLSLIELGNMSKLNPVIILFQLAENFAYRNADKVVSILPNTLEYMKKHGLQADKFVYVPNGISEEDWSGKRELSVINKGKINELKKQHKFLIAYAGAHGVANALDSFIKAAGYIRDFPIHLLLIGKGPEKNKLIEIAESKNFNNITFLDSVPKNEIPELLSMMDALYIGLQNQPIFRFGISPNKLLDYMMAGKPIIQAINAGNDLVTEAGCGITVEPENSKSIANAMIRLYKMPPEERQDMGNAGHYFVVQNHEYKVLAEKFLSAVNTDMFNHSM